MYASAREMVFSHLQDHGFFKESNQDCYLQWLEDELLSNLHSNVFMNSCLERNHGDTHLSFLGDQFGSNMLGNSILSDYSFGGEEFLFQAQEPIIEEPLLPLDPVAESISMISSAKDIISGETIEAAEIESLGTEPLLNEIYCELKKDLLGSLATKEPPSGLPNNEAPTMLTKDVKRIEEEERSTVEGALQKCVSSECLTVNAFNGWPDFASSGMDMGATFRMRRAYSEGDIETLSNIVPQVNMATVYQFPLESFKSRERLQKIFRYRMKKSTRNFGRKIKYACRKALADSQPRKHGRFAKTEERE